MKYQYIIISGNYDNDALSGRLLKIFLDEFVASDQILFVSEDLFRKRSEAVDTEYLFLSVPTQITYDELKTIRYKKIIAFDYYDEFERNLGLINKDILGCLSGYFKTSIDDSHDYEATPIGLLPIRIPGTLEYLSRKRLTIKRNHFLHDVNFIGTTTYLKNIDYNQRVEWVRTVKDAKKYDFWGGLLELPYNTKEMLDEKYNAKLDDYFV